MVGGEKKFVWFLFISIRLRCAFDIFSMNIRNLYMYIPSLSVWMHHAVFVLKLFNVSMKKLATSRCWMFWNIDWKKSLMFLCQSGITDEVKRQRYRTRISDYMDRAEKLKQHVEKEKEGWCLLLTLKRWETHECIYSAPWLLIPWC